MRNYCDLHLKISNFPFEKYRQVAELTREVGFKSLGVVFPPNVNLDEVKRVKNLFKEFGVDVASRVNFKPEGRGELLRYLRKFRRKFEVVGVECMSNQVSVVAARDGRVDVIFFPLNSRSVRFRETVAHVTNNALEINLVDLISSRIPRSLVISEITREVSIAKKNHVPIVISSGVDKPSLIMAPRDMAACGLLFGLKRYEALNSVSTIPSRIVKVNREKLSGRYVSEGVRIVSNVNKEK